MTHRKSVSELKSVTNLLINDFKIKELGHDFMGHSLQQGDVYTFHHAIVPNREGGKYVYWNGVVLFSTPHQYLHAIESVSDDYFYWITSEMLDMKMKGFLDESNLKEINNILCEFEDKYKNRYTRRGKKLIKDEYLNRVYYK